MGSSISPPTAMTYMEHFEEYLYERKMPAEIKATVWDRYVDDCFVVYKHSDADFDRFFNVLNSLDPFIKFTYERSHTGDEADLGPDVEEALPFLDLVVIRHVNRESNTLSTKLAIYRKPTHSGTYIHSLSAQPLATKRSVIRSLFLRAFRYSDPLFLAKEIEKIYADFERLGYNRRFIDKAKISAKKGRDNEVKIRQGLMPPKPPRTKQPFNLIVPYHGQTKGLKQVCAERGVDVIHSSRDSLGSRIANRKKTPIDSGVYILPCKDPSCEKIYVGQSSDLPTRFDDHRAGIAGRNSLSKYASVRHTHPGTTYRMDPDNAIVPYRSTSKSHRLIIETSLIKLCNTVDHTKASSDPKDMDSLGPIILAASNIDWKLLATTQPSFNHRFIPKAYRRFFQPSNNIHQPNNEPILVPPVPPRYPLRSNSSIDN